jgi:hypothetical protein
MFIPNVQIDKFPDVSHTLYLIQIERSTRMGPAAAEAASSTSS